MSVLFEKIKTKLKLYRPRATKPPCVLLVLDGWGVAPPSNGNAIDKAKIPNFRSYLEKYPNTQLIASGESVGLPANEVGNTEVGHMTLGAGRLVYQDLKRISIAIQDESFFINPAFVAAAEHVKRQHSRLHIMGLAGTGNVHSSLEHLYALLRFCKSKGVHEVLLHLFTDGRDTPPQEALEIIGKVENQLQILKVGRIATLAGRYYAMDRDTRWERTEKAYEAIVAGKGPTALSVLECIKNSYTKGLTDEFIEPTVIKGEDNYDTSVHDGDSLIFFNFRIDRPRQLTMAFVIPDFETLESYDFGFIADRQALHGHVSFGKTFTRSVKPKNIYFVTMTEYQKGLSVNAVAFAPQVITDSVPAALSAAKRTHLHIAESEKERFVTYYFRGMNDRIYEGEESIIVPSPKVATYDKKPEMSLSETAQTLILKISQASHDFYIMNIANPDMVAHTGSLEATIKACEIVDGWVGKIVSAVLKKEGTAILTADHGNAEELVTYPTGSFFFTTNTGKVNTDHSNNPVPIVMIARDLAGKKISGQTGTLADVGPTILARMGIPRPAGMNGRNLLEATQ